MGLKAFDSSSSHMRLDYHVQEHILGIGCASREVGDANSPWAYEHTCTCIGRLLNTFIFAPFGPAGVFTESQNIENQPHFERWTEKV